MKDAEVKKQNTRVKALFLKWHNAMGFRWWDDLRLITYSGPLEPYPGEEAFHTPEETARTQADCKSDWRYLHGTVRVSLPNIMDLDDDQLERTIVHELCHALVNEMREDGIDHEERVVTQLAQAFIWVRDLERKAKK